MSLEDQVLLALQYWREYRTYFHIAQSWNINESTAFRLVRRGQGHIDSFRSV
ncbi:helix-turn-helix domain-containing protein [Microcoleus sp. Pol1C5]|uniref:helix-turn-helix domain-containing protein n=1 Tax=Microcoleus sp. Pol1C5 TaxID=3055406 RepID=UPI00403F2956